MKVFLEHYCFPKLYIIISINTFVDKVKTVQHNVQLVIKDWKLNIEIVITWSCDHVVVSHSIVTTSQGINSSTCTVPPNQFWILKKLLNCAFWSILREKFRIFWKFWNVSNHVIIYLGDFLGRVLKWEKFGVRLGQKEVMANLELDYISTFYISLKQRKLQSCIKQSISMNDDTWTLKNIQIKY